MQKSYFYKLLDSWTPPMEYLPRWISGNGYPELTTYTSLPSSTTYNGPGVGYTTYFGEIPNNWVHSTLTPSTTGSILQKFFEVLTYTKDQFRIPLYSLRLARTAYFDLADLSYAWIASSEELVTKLELAKQGGTKLEISRAEGIYDLFHSGEIKWLQQGSTVLITNIDLLEDDTEFRAGAGDWYFASSPSRWAPTRITYFAHPTTKNLISIHPSELGENGFLGYLGTIPTKIRTRSAVLTDLPEVNIYINDEAKVATITDLWTSLDEKGLWYSFYRKPNETNAQFSQALLGVSWFAGQTLPKTETNISSRLRQLFYEAPATSGFTKPTASKARVRNFINRTYLFEDLLPGETFGTYLTNYPDYTYGVLFINGLEVPFTVSGSVVTPAQLVDSDVTRAVMHWVVPNWTETATAFTFKECFYPEEDLQYCYTAKVNVIQASEKVARDSFKNSQKLKWQREVNDALTFGVTEIRGLAIFE